MTDTKTDDLMALRLEYRLTVAHRINSSCECVRYFIQRRDVLVPEVMKHAESIGADPVDEFARFARGVHARHLAGLSLDVSA